jgi:hypothetical protein
VLVYRASGGPAPRIVPDSMVTSEASIRSASQLAPDERALLRALAEGTLPAVPDAELEGRLDALRRRFDVLALPASRRDQVLLQRARALGAMAPGPG